MNRDLRKGDAVIVSFPEQLPSGREQAGIRPAIVVAVPAGTTRYPLLLVAPLTTQAGKWVNANPGLYPRLPEGTGNLNRASTVLLDQVRAVDIRRISKYVGSLNQHSYEPIASGLRKLFN